MGGHGGLNILPQKRWNVYNYENREKVRKDEAAAAREEQLKREQSRKRDAEFCLEKLRQARGLASSGQAAEPESRPESESYHINLFEGIRVFDPVGIEGERDEKRKEFKKMKKKVQLPPKVIMPEDEKYRLGHGVAGKGVMLPWYMEKQSSKNGQTENSDNDDDFGGKSEVVVKTNVKKKTLEELREERLKREKREKERERALLIEKRQRSGAGLNERVHSWWV